MEPGGTAPIMQGWGPWGRAAAASRPQPCTPKEARAPREAPHGIPFGTLDLRTLRRLPLPEPVGCQWALVHLRAGFRMAPVPGHSTVPEQPYAVGVRYEEHSSVRRIVVTAAPGCALLNYKTSLCLLERPDSHKDSRKTSAVVDMAQAHECEDIVRSPCLH